MDLKSPSDFFTEAPDIFDVLASKFRDHEADPTFNRFISLSPYSNNFMSDTENKLLKDNLDRSSLVKKTIKKTDSKKKYSSITNELRLKLIDAVDNHKEKIKHAAKKLGINYSSAKSIYQIYKREGRREKMILKRKYLKGSDIIEPQTKGLPLKDDSMADGQDNLQFVQQERPDRERFHEIKLSDQNFLLRGSPLELKDVTLNGSQHYETAINKERLSTQREVSSFQIKPADFSNHINQTKQQSQGNHKINQNYFGSYNQFQLRQANLASLNNSISAQIPQQSTYNLPLGFVAPSLGSSQESFKLTTPYQNSHNSTNSVVREKDGENVFNYDNRPRQTPFLNSNLSSFHNQNTSFPFYTVENETIMDSQNYQYSANPPHYVFNKNVVQASPFPEISTNQPFYRPQNDQLLSQSYSFIQGQAQSPIIYYWGNPIQNVPNVYQNLNLVPYIRHNHIQVNDFGEKGSSNSEKPNQTN